MSHDPLCPSSIGTPTRRLRHTLWPFVAALTLASAAGCSTPTSAQEASAPRHELPAVDRAPAPRLGTLRAEPVELRDGLVVAGTLYPARSVDVFGPWPGRVRGVAVDEGSLVEADAVLVELDTAAARAQVAQSRAQAASSRVQLEQALTERTRLEPLADQGLVPRQQVDQLRSQADAIRESVEAIDAMTRVAQVQVRDGTVRAPFAGTVTRVHVEAGAMATGATPLVRLVDLRHVDARLTVPEAWVDGLRVGDTLLVDIPSLGEAREGTIRFVDPEMDEATRAAHLYVRLPNPDGRLRAGASATARIETTAGARRLLALPTEAVLRSGDGTFAFRVVDGVARRTPVEVTSARVGWHVRSGLDGDELLLEGELGRVRDGQSVAAVLEGAPEVTP